MNYIIKTNDLEKALKTLQSDNHHPIYFAGSNNITVTLISANNVSVTLGVRNTDLDIEVLLERKNDSRNWNIVDGYDSPDWSLKLG